jgi:hypothetical protein
MEPPNRILDRILAPAAGFRRRAGEAPGMAEALGGMLLLRVPTAWAGLALGYAALVRSWAQAGQLQGPFWDNLRTRLPEGMDPADLGAALGALPPLPTWTRALPWLALLAPLAVLGLWLHDAAWDHLGLWLLRGAAPRQPLRATLLAEAEALKVGTLGALAGLAAQLPWTGPAVALLALAAAAYCWILRGYALAAWHGCPPWKGVLATLLHAFFMLVLALGTVLLLFALLLQVQH